jgi:hypothetical protein
MSAESVPGMNGRITDRAVLADADTGDSLGPSVDLVGMARKAIAYLASNPDPLHGYQCRFNYYLLRSPPFDLSALLWGFDVRGIARRDSLIDPIAVGDTESRNDIAFTQMWEMAGSRDGKVPHDKVHERLESYIRTGSGRVGDDVCWIVPYCMSSTIDAPCVSVWTTAKLLQSSADLYGLTRDAHHRQVARRLFEGLRRLASWDSGRAFFSHGSQRLRDDGGFADANDAHYPNLLSGLLRYGERCGDTEALDFARAMAEGFLSDLQPRHFHQPDGSVLGHNHSTMHAVRGVAQLGAATGDWRFLDWAKAAYDYYWSNAFDTGWLPEILSEADHCGHSETCLTADMIETSAWFARAGRPRYWDRVERAVRNYLVPAQFVLTPEVEHLWRQIHHDKPREVIEEGLLQLRDREGGFLSAFTPNDRVFEVPPGRNHHGIAQLRGTRIVLDMMGCCPPEGMRALYTAWANIVTESEGKVLVNMAFDHDCAQAMVKTGMPSKGTLDVEARTAGEFYLRPPSWAPREKVQALRNKSEIAPRWDGPAHDYILFPGVHPGDLMEIRWPLVSFTQTVVARRFSEKDGRIIDVAPYVYRWVGSTVTSVDPKGSWLPLYERR